MAEEPQEEATRPQKNNLVGQCTSSTENRAKQVPSRPKNSPRPRNHQQSKMPRGGTVVDSQARGARSPTNHEEEHDALQDKKQDKQQGQNKNSEA